MKTLAAIRLLLAVALMVLFSGTMAFAHSDHDHSKASYAAVSVDTSPAPVSAKDLAPTTASVINVSLDKPATVFEARSEFPATSIPHGAGCCCCGGPSSCGMAGGCAVHALFPGQGLLAPELLANSHLITALPMLTGCGVAGPDRPPNA